MAILTQAVQISMAIRSTNCSDFDGIFLFFRFKLKKSIALQYIVTTNDEKRT